MTNPFRERIWFVTGFLKKYFVQILFGLGITVAISVIGSFVYSKLPQAKPTYRIGIIGQFNAGQLPSLILNFLNAGLVSVNSKFEPIPNLAEKWDIDQSRNTYTFYLKPDLKWSDGKQLKASDIKISIPNISVETVDPNIIKFHIPTKFSPFPTLLTIPLLNQKGKIVGEYDVRLKQKSSGVISQIILESPSKKLIFGVYSTPKQAIVAYKLGQIDLVLGLPSEFQSEVASFGKIKKIVDYNKVILMVFNQSDPNLKDKNVRQGLAYSMKDKVFGQAEAFTTINPKSWAFNPLVKTYPFTQSKANEFIKNPVSLELSTPPELLSFAEAIKNQFNPAQINISTKVITSSPDQFQLYLMAYNIPTDPDQYRDWHSTQATNIGKGSDEKIDKALEDGRITLDQKLRKQIYYDFQKTFAEELPALVLFHPSEINLARKENLFNLINFQN